MSGPSPCLSSHAQREDVKVHNWRNALRHGEVLDAVRLAADGYLERIRPAPLWSDEAGARIWLVDQVTDPVSAQRELMRMGRVANVIVFSPSRGSPADFFAP